MIAGVMKGKRAIVLMLAAGLFASCGGLEPGAESYLPENAPAATSRDNELAAEIEQQLNSLRKSEGKSRVRVNEKVSTVARIHSRDMAAGLAPLGIDGQAARRSAAGLLSSGEMVAAVGNRGEGTAKRIVDFLASDEDNRFMLVERGPKCGIGVAHSSDGRAFVTLIMGTR